MNHMDEETEPKKSQKIKPLFGNFEPFVSGYRLMWMLVLFDLPTNTPEQRKKASKFRKFLLDQGFQMSQYSFYMRLLSSKDKGKKLHRLIEAAVPSEGYVQVIEITDKQYENIRSFYHHQKKKNNMPEQLQLF